MRKEMTTTGDIPSLDRRQQKQMGQKVIVVAKESFFFFYTTLHPFFDIFLSAFNSHVPSATWKNEGSRDLGAWIYFCSVSSHTFGVFFFRLRGW